MSSRQRNIFEHLDFDEHVRSYIADRMPSIDGWLSEHEASIFAMVDEVQRRESISGYLAELGVWHGRGALLLATLRRPDELVYAADIFDLRSRNHSHFNDPEVFISYCRELGVEESVRLIRIDTAETPQRLPEVFPATGCRIFHVDGGHEYKSVRHDMAFAASVLAEGGVLACDDVFAVKFPGVTQALVEMLLANPALAPFALSNKKAWITSRSHAPMYREHVRARCSSCKFRTSTFMDETVLILK